MYKNRWTRAFILAGFLAFPSTVAMAAATVTMVVIPCLPGMPPDQCGVKLSTEGPASFTLNNGQVLSLSPGTIYSVSGDGQVTQQPGTLNFASLTSTTTASIGGGGGGAGATDPNPARGGTNSGGTTFGTNSAANTPNFPLTGGGTTGTSGSVSP
jgi:hypothetical protein